MHRSFIVFGISIAQLLIAPPLIAGMKSDLALCAKASGLPGTRACSRILESGRLRRSQYYIAYYNRGWAHRNAGKLQQALGDFNKSLKYNSRYADTHYSRAVVQYERSDTDASIDSLEKYISMMKRSWQAYYKRALMLRRLGDLHRAMGSIEKAISLKPSIVELQSTKALILSDLGRHEEALELITQNAKTGCGTPRQCYVKAQISSRQEQNEMALALLEAAAKANDIRAAVHLSRGRVLEKLSRRLDAMREYRRSIILQAKSVEELLSQADARQRLSELEATAKIPVAKSEPSKDCRVFVPAGNMTMAVPCTTQ